MIRRFDDEAAIVTDAYIDLLLDASATRDASSSQVTSAHRRPLAPELREAIDLLQSGLPRFHPSFHFEERLAARLRAGTTNAVVATADGEVIRLDIPAPHGVARRVGPRALLGGAAIASGMSVAAVYAWRHAARRGRRTREVIA